MKEPLVDLSATPEVAALAKVDLYLRQEVFPRLERIVARQQGREPYACRQQGWEIVRAGSDRANVRVLALRASRYGPAGDPTPVHPHLFRHARVRQIVRRHAQSPTRSAPGRLESAATGLPVD